MINVLQRLAELDSKNPRVEKPLINETPVLNTEGLKQLNVNMPEPDMTQLRQLSGLMESRQFSNTIAECGMPAMGAPMPSTPASLSMTAASGAEIVTMMRGLADIAAGAPSSTGMPALGAPMPNMHAHRDTDPMGADALGDAPGPDMEVDKQVSGPTFGSDTGADGMPGGDELADMMRKLQTGQPVKIKTDMPVKVKTTNPVSGGDKPEEGNAFGAAAASAEKGEKFSVDGKEYTKTEDEKTEEDARMWDTSPKEKTRDYNPNDFAHIFNKVKELDATKAPRVADNPLKAESKKESGNSLDEATAKLMSEYRSFVEEGKKCNESPAGKKCPVHGLKECGSMYEAEERLPAKKKETSWTDKSGKTHKAMKVQGHQSRKADKEADKEKKSHDLDEAKKGVRAPKHKIHSQGTASKDWDGDGKKESPKDEVWGSRAKAAAKAGKPFSEESERVMTRAAKGVMKYGKDGMKALAKAGREGKNLDKVRAKYDKYD